jgi:hypothetical protein
MSHANLLPHQRAFRRNGLALSIPIFSLALIPSGLTERRSHWQRKKRRRDTNPSRGQSAEGFQHCGLMETMTGCCRAGLSRKMSMFFRWSWAASQLEIILCVCLTYSIHPNHHKITKILFHTYLDLAVRCVWFYMWIMVVTERFSACYPLCVWQYKSPQFNTSIIHTYWDLGCVWIYMWIMVVTEGIIIACYPLCVSDSTQYIQIATI